MDKWKIAWSLRSQLERYAQRNGFSSDLSCLCAISSFCLRDLFRRYGFESEVMLGKFHNEYWKGANHCWVSDQNEQFWDLTITQFDVTDKVFVCRSGHKYYKEGRPIELEHLISWPFAQYPSFLVLESLTNDTISLLKLAAPTKDVCERTQKYCTASFR